MSHDSRQRLSTAFNVQLPATRFIRYLIALLALVASVAGFMRMVNGVETRSHADSVYVRRDTFALYRKDVASDQRDMLRILSSIDSTDRCKRGQAAFCR